MTKLALRAHVLALFAMLAFSPGPSALAGTFGESIETYTGTISQCTYAVVGSIPVKVDVPSLVYANAVSTYDPADNPGNSLVLYILQLRKSGNDLASAYSNSYYTLDKVALGSYATLVSSGVMKDHSTNQPFKVPSGDYILEFIVQSGNNSCSSTPLPAVKAGTLSYMLFSSTLDDIFAGGFNAMLYNENRIRALASNGGESHEDNVSSDSAKFAIGERLEIATS